MKQAFIEAKQWRLNKLQQIVLDLLMHKDIKDEVLKDVMISHSCKDVTTIPPEHLKYELGLMRVFIHTINRIGNN